MKVWVTKTGESIAYKDLGDKHLLNILYSIKIGKIRCVKREREVIFQDNGDDWETYETEASIEETKKFLDYDGLLKEAQKRGLNTQELTNC